MEPQFVVIEKFILLPWQHDMTLLRAKTYQKAVCRFFFFSRKQLSKFEHVWELGLKKWHSIVNFFLLLSATCTVFFFLSFFCCAFNSFRKAFRIIGSDGRSVGGYSVEPYFHHNFLGQLYMFFACFSGVLD